MKSYALFVKTFCSFLLVIALCSLFLPCIQLTTGQGITRIAGADLLKASVKAGLEYYKTGEVNPQLVISNPLTWGELRSYGLLGIQEITAVKFALLLLFLSLPYFFTVLSMLLLLTAIGRKTMILPTILEAWTTLQTAALFLVVWKIEPFKLLIGMYGYFLGNLAVLVLLLILWITHGLDVPKENQSDGKKKSKRKRRKSGRQFFRKCRKKSKKRASKKKDQKTKNRKEMIWKPQFELSGMYDGINMNAMKVKEDTYLIASSKEQIRSIETGQMAPFDLMDQEHLLIHYEKTNREFCISNYTSIGVMVKIKGEYRVLEQEENLKVSSGAKLVIGNSDNTILLKLHKE